MIRALLFDLNGTVIDILTDEGNDDLYRMLANLLEYQGIPMAPDALRERFRELNRRQRSESCEAYPEFDAIEIFRAILRESATPYYRSLPRERREQLPLFLAEAFRAASRFKLTLYPGVEAVLGQLKKYYRLAAVSDAQRAWAIPELHSVGLEGMFDPVLISSDFGFRKPDRRMFDNALEQLGVTAGEALFIGNDMRHDILGAHKAGLRTVFFKSNQGDHDHHGADADYIIYSFWELPDAIRFLSNR